MSEATYCMDPLIGSHRIASVAQGPTNPHPVGHLAQSQSLSD